MFPGKAHAHRGFGRSTFPVIIIEARPSRLGEALAEVWRRRELVAFLLSRNVKVRYRQTVLGLSWLVLQPLVLMGIYTLFVGRLLRVPTDGVPYHLFVLAGLIPWLFFSSAAQSGAQSLVGDQSLVSRIYFPRLALPIAGVLTHALDFLVSSMFLLLFVAAAGFSPSAGWLALPAILVMTALTAMAVAIPLAALNVKYRDVQAGMGLLLQLWLFASPVLYPMALVPDAFQTVYALNPMVGIVTLSRKVLLGGDEPVLSAVLSSILVTALLLLLGLRYFAGSQHEFADAI